MLDNFVQTKKQYFYDLKKLNMWNKVFTLLYEGVSDSTHLAMSVGKNMAQRSNLDCSRHLSLGTSPTTQLKRQRFKMERTILIESSENCL